MLRVRGLKFLETYYILVKMDLVFATEARFFKGEGHRYYTDSASFGMQLWERYLSSFDKIYIMARVSELKNNFSSDYCIDDSRIAFIPIPYYVGFVDFFKRYMQVKRAIKLNALSGRAYICRVPGQIGQILAGILKSRHIPYAVEVVGDPWDVFAPGSISHPLAPLFRVVGFFTLRKVVIGAKDVLYVTKYSLQYRYPCDKDAYSTYASDVKIDASLLASFSKRYISFSAERAFSFLAVGSLEQMYKAPDIQLEALALLKEQGYKVKLKWMGDGKYKSPMEDYARQLGVDNNVEFVGAVSSERIYEELMSADLFLHVSRTEGLPRAIIEAMVCGLPCIGTRVGGIPELLDEKALIISGDSKALANKIQEFISNSTLMNEQAMRNWNKAKSYDNRILTQRRADFYQHIINSVNQ